MGGKNPRGYGCFKVKGRMLRAHRVSYMLHVGEIPQGMFICHRCDNPSCVRPDHLFLGTCDDNLRDASIKGRLGGAKHGSKTKPETVNRGESHGRAKLTESDVHQILAMKDTHTDRRLAAMFGVDSTQISLIHRGKSWRHVSRT